MKPGRVVLVLAGRYAGKKAVIVKNYDDGSNDRPYGHALLAGVARYPLKITKGMGKKRVKKRSRIKTFCKVTNYNHMMPTRLALFRVILDIHNYLKQPDILLMCQLIKILSTKMHSRMLLIGEKQEVKSNRNFKKGNYVFLNFNLFEVL